MYYYYNQDEEEGSESRAAPRIISGAKSMRCTLYLELITEPLAPGILLSPTYIRYSTIIQLPHHPQPRQTLCCGLSARFGCLLAVAGVIVQFAAASDRFKTRPAGEASQNVQDAAS